MKGFWFRVSSFGFPGLGHAVFEGSKMGTPNREPQEYGRMVGI